MASLHPRSPGAHIGSGRRRPRITTPAPLVVACLRCAGVGATRTTPTLRPRIATSTLLAASPPGHEGLPPPPSGSGGGDEIAPVAKDNNNNNNNNNNDINNNDEDAGRDDPSLDPGARAALAFIRLYREGVSPLLQPACRYQPTCSRYAIAAFRAYGGWRGSVLTVWRLARCAPWGRGGVDPPLWPPPGLGYVFQYDAAAPVAVVLIVAGLVRLTHALLFE